MLKLSEMLSQLPLKELALVSNALLMWAPKQRTHILAPKQRTHILAPKQRTHIMAPKQRTHILCSHKHVLKHVLFQELNDAKMTSLVNS